MSYLYCVILYEKGRFDPALVEGCVHGCAPSFAGEHLTQISVTAKVDAIFYLAGAFATKALAFMYACEDYLIDGFPDRVAAAFRASGPPADSRFYVWLSSDMFPHDVAMKYTPDGFEGRALMQDRGEQVLVAKQKLCAYAMEEVAVNPENFGLRGDDESNFDEDAYQAACAKRSEPFDPARWIRGELKVTRAKVIDALQDLESRGKVLWPEGGPRYTPALKKKTARCDDPIMPDLPLWAYLREQLDPAPKAVEKPEKPEKPAKATKKRVAKPAKSAKKPTA